jgi:hypothetical protein
VHRARGLTLPERAILRRCAPQNDMGAYNALAKVAELLLERDR